MKRRLSVPPQVVGESVGFGFEDFGEVANVGEAALQGGVGDATSGGEKLLGVLDLFLANELRDSHAKMLF